MSSSKKISQLNSVTIVADNDVLPVVQGSETKKVTKSDLLKEVNAKADNAVEVADIAKSETEEHIGNKSNPHEVTKAQVGLGNVDNTSDANKPISNATATALANKSNVGHTHTASEVTDFDEEVSNNADVSANTEARHTHSNKTLLDTYTQTESDLADAVSKKHTRNADSKLDEGGSSEVSAFELKSHLGATNNPHAVTKSQVGLGNVTNDAQVKRSEMGTANGVSTLGSDGKIPNSQLPALAITNTFVVLSQAEQLALDAQEGDVAVRVDLSKSYIKNSGTAGTMADWQELLTPTDAVLSVNGQTGAVVLTSSNISEGSNLYFTNARARGAISGTTNQVNYDSATGTISLPQNIHTSATPRFAGIGLNQGAQSSALVAGTLNSTINKGFYLQADQATARFPFGFFVTGDAQLRFTVNAGGELGWGSGSVVTDTNLYRNAVNTLKTDGDFIVGGNITATNLAISNWNTAYGWGNHAVAGYALLAGRSSGQTLIGGTGVTDVLSLVGTSGNGTAGNAGIQLKVGNNGATTALTVLNNGNVGVGTTTPTTNFSVTGNTYMTGGLGVGTLNTTAGTIQLSTNGSTATPSIGWGTTGFYKTAGNSIIYTNGASDLISLISDGSLTAVGNLKTGSGSAATPGHSFAAQSNIGMFRAGTDLLGFSTAGTERLRIDGSGNVGIGTTAPSTKLHVIGTSNLLRFGYDVSNYLNVDVSSGGVVTIDAVGASAKFVFSDSVEATKLKATTANGFISSDGSTGATGTWTTVDGKTITAKDGLITAIV